MTRGILLVALALALLGWFAVPAAAQVLPNCVGTPTAPCLNNSEIPGSVLVYPKFLTGTVNVGSVNQPVAAPRSAFELSVTCPSDLARCNTGTAVRLRAHWVCPGSQDGFFKFNCQEEDFILQTTVKGTLFFNPENVDFARSPPTDSSTFVSSVPFPPCDAGYLIVWVVSPDDADNNRAISFNALIGNGILRESANSAGAYNAIPIQSVQPSFSCPVGGPGEPAGTCPPTALAPTLLDDTPFGSRTLVFDGVTEYALIPGKAVATLRLDRDFISPLVIGGPAFRIDTFLTLLTLDVNSNRSNLPTFVDLQFYSEVERPLSTSQEFICWMERSLSRPNPALQGQTTPACGPAGPCINRNLRETRFTTGSIVKKVLMETDQAVKEQFSGVNDATCTPSTVFNVCTVTGTGASIFVTGDQDPIAAGVQPCPAGTTFSFSFGPGTCPVTLLGLIETKERGLGGANAPYNREYAYGLFNNGPGIPTFFIPN